MTPALSIVIVTLMLIEVLPRTVAATVLRRADAGARRSALGFHLRALLRPGLLAGPWGPPPEPGPAEAPG